MRINPGWVFFLSVLIILSGLALYLFHFSDGFSKDSDAWGHFGDYLSLFVSITSLIVLGYLATVTNQISTRSLEVTNMAHDTNAQFQARQQMPVLDFTIKRSRTDFFPAYRESWFLLNCSDAAARNISLRFQTVNEQVYLVSMYSLQQDETLEMPWLRWAFRIEIYFTDAFGDHHYRVVMENLRSNFTEIEPGEYNAIRNQPQLNVADIINNFEQRFVALGRAFTGNEYLQLLNSLQPVPAIV